MQFFKEKYIINGTIATAAPTRKEMAFFRIFSQALWIHKYTKIKNTAIHIPIALVTLDIRHSPKVIPYKKAYRGLCLGFSLSFCETHSVIK